MAAGAQTMLLVEQVAVEVTEVFLVCS